MKRVRNADDVERALKAKNIPVENGRGKTKEATVDYRTYSKLRWQEGEQFSEPRAAYFTGILRAFKIIPLKYLIVGAGAFYLAYELLSWLGV